MKITKNDIAQLAPGEVLLAECSYKEYYSAKNYAYQLARYDEIREKGISRFSVTYNSKESRVCIKAIAQDA